MMSRGRGLPLNPLANKVQDHDRFDFIPIRLRLTEGENVELFCVLSMPLDRTRGCSIPIGKMSFKILKGRARSLRNLYRFGFLALPQQREQAGEQRTRPVLASRGSIRAVFPPTAFFKVLTDVVLINEFAAVATVGEPLIETADVSEPGRTCQLGISLFVEPLSKRFQHIFEGTILEPLHLRDTLHIVIQHRHTLSTNRGGIAHGYAQCYVNQEFCKCA